MKTRRALLIVLSVGLFGGLLAAQTAGQEYLGRARENIHRLRLLRMTEALELSEQQTAVIYPAASRIEKEKTEILRRHNTGMRDLREWLSADHPDEAAIADLTAELKGLRTELLAKDREFEDFLDAQLTPIQKARYLVFSADFYRGLGEQINRARAMAREKRKS